MVLTSFWLAQAGPARAQELIISDQTREKWGAVGRVNIGGFKSRALCTGVLIAPDQVLTAAHCVVDPKTGEPFQIYRVHFVAAWHKGAHRGTAKAKSIHVHPDYPVRPRKRRGKITPQDIAHDVAVITLKGQLDDVPPARLTEAHAEDAPVVILGYRSDRPNVLSDHLGCVASTAGATLLRLSCPVVQGTSGAPVLQKSPTGDWHIIGVVSASNENGGIAVAVTAQSLREAGLLPP